MRALVLIPLVLTLTACANRSAPPPEAPTITAPNFSDSDPHPWDGRSPDAYPVHGIDISRWQPQVDWPTARANGVNFAFIKATEGGDILDPAYKENWAGAARAGVPRGAYHFYYWCRPAAEQARWFIQHVPRSPGALPPVLDMEWTPFSPTCTKRPPAAEVRAEAQVFLTLLERHYGQRPLIYTTPEFFETNQMARLSGYPFWLRSTAAHPGDLYGHPWTFWQYTGTGLVPGIAGKTDINVFAGNRQAWTDWLATQTR
ncbi:MAG: glycoside hydrolase family 25 protein [Paracoccaceae bacterium]